jgi:hypothetical protein
MTVCMNVLYVCNMLFVASCSVTHMLLYDDSAEIQRSNPKESCAITLIMQPQEGYILALSIFACLSLRIHIYM